VNLGAAVVLLPQASVPAGEYELVPDTNRWVEVKRWDGDQIYWSIGRLDAVGNFVPDEEYFNRTGPKTKAPPNVTLLNRDGMGAVYEYRSGALVKGRINGMLNFVPEVGSTVIDFKDYKYGPGALPIWNLPGSFKKK
jgi:hypothetical protein